MNEQLPISLSNQLELELTLPQRAQRIRDLVGTARLCIIEIGRELIAAKAVVLHGDWLPWIDREFGWKELTAQRYMQVARAFQIHHADGFAGLTIDASALYVLSAPDVPQDARDEALARAEDGERITKAEAEEMIAKANADFEAKALEAIEVVRKAQAAETQAAIDEATETLAADNDALQAEIRKIKAAARKPNVQSIAESLCKTTGRKKLGDDQWRLLAQLLGVRIAVGKRAFDPISAEQLKVNEERLRTGTLVTQALEALAAAPPVEAMRDITWEVQRKQHVRLIDFVRSWVNDYYADLMTGATNAKANAEAGTEAGDTTDALKGTRGPAGKTDTRRRRPAG